MSSKLKKCSINDCPKNSEREPTIFIFSAEGSKFLFYL